MPNKDEVLGFPLKGLHVTREVDQQPDNTTADCSNVASRDSIAGRTRGGSRAGFSKYCEGQSLLGAVNIQMLEVIVDPKAAALVQPSQTPGDDWIEHPRFPGIFIPPRGAPWQPTDQATQPAPPTTNMTINVVLTAFAGGEDVATLSVTLIQAADVRTGTDSYVFSWDGGGIGTAFEIECSNDIGVIYPDEVTVSSPPIDLFGSPGNNLGTGAIPFVSGGVVSIEFTIKFG